MLFARQIGCRKIRGQVVGAKYEGLEGDRESIVLHRLLMQALSIQLLMSHEHCALFL